MGNKETGPSEGYLFMNNSADSNQIPTSANSQSDFDCRFSPKLRKVEGEAINNSGEMLPINSLPKPDCYQKQVSEFSNASYENAPLINSST